HCEECGDPIPQARREALPGVRLCVPCQTEHDADQRQSAGYNRRGSKDSQYVEIPARYRKELCLHTAVPETPAVAVQLTGREPLFLVMNSRSGKQDSEATRQAIRTACAEAGRRCELLVVERGADLASAARKAVTLAREQGGIVVAV